MILGNDVPNLWKPLHPATLSAAIVLRVALSRSLSFSLDLSLDIVPSCSLTLCRFLSFSITPPSLCDILCRFPSLSAAICRYLSLLVARPKGRVNHICARPKGHATRKCAIEASCARQRRSEAAPF